MLRMLHAHATCYAARSSFPPPRCAASYCTPLPGHHPPEVCRFLAYDLLACAGRAIGAQPLHKRLALLGAEVFAPRKAADTGGEKLRVRQKDCFRLKHVPYLLRQLMPQLTHAHRGLVFLLSDAPYGGPGAVAEWSPAAPPCTAPGAEPPITDTELTAWAGEHFAK